MNTSQEFLAKDSRFLNSLALRFAELESDEDLFNPMLVDIRKHTNAVLGVFSQYDSLQKALIVKSVEAEGKILSAFVKIVGSKIIGTFAPVNYDAYVQIIGERIAIHKSLAEITFGSVPKPIDIALKKATGIASFYGVAHIVSGNLYGTTLLGFREDQAPPTFDFLNSFAYMVALALRRSLAEKMLIENEAKLRRITDNIRDVVFVTDLNLNTTFVTPSIERMHGDTVEQYLKRKVEERHPPETIAHLKKILAEELENEKNPAIDKNRSRIVEGQLIKANGSIINTSMHISFIRDDKGNPIGIQGVTRDITELKKNEQQLIKLNADKDRFLQILAHDLKNPIGNLVSSSDVLQKYYNNYEPEKVEKFLNLFNKVSNSTYNLLENLLLWSKAQSGKLQPKMDNIDLSRICYEIAMEFAPLMKQKKISIQYPQETVQAVADKNMITTVIRNLVSNAIKFTNNEGEVIITSYEENGSITVVVKDNGVGMSPQDQQKLWNFANPHTTTGTAKEKGTGLGLLICKEFVEMHDGEISIESQVDNGSQFIFCLPQNKA